MNDPTTTDSTPSADSAATQEPTVTASATPTVPPAEPPPHTDEPALPVTPPRRFISEHVVNECNASLHVSTLDAPGAGGANHLYHIEGFNTATNDSDPFTARHGESAKHSTVIFQNGPIKEKGVNGITQEVLLVIVADRLQSFQNGPYACPENQHALDHIRQAMGWLHTRTARRDASGIEGTSARD